MDDAQAISAKLEDYVEAIHELSVERRVARAGEIARRMRVRKPSVTAALRHLAAHGLVNYEPYQFVTLTARGGAMAHSLLRRHGALKSFLVQVLGLSERQAESDACGMEHALSEQSFRRLVAFVERAAGGSGRGTRRARRADLRTRGGRVVGNG